MVYYCRSKTTQ